MARLLGAIGGRGKRRAERYDARTAPLHLREAPLPLSSVREKGEGRKTRRPSARNDGQRHLAALLAPLCGSASEGISLELLARFGSLPALLRANRRTLERQLPDGSSELVDLLLAVRPIIDNLLKAEMLDAPVLPDNRAAIRYLHATMAHEPAEQVRVLYLDAKNRVVRDETAARGSVRKTEIVPREIIRRALDLGATGLIMAHNHPSGDPEPSRHDLTATRAVADAARLFDLVLHDHIVLGRGGYRSLREDGYL